MRRSQGLVATVLSLPLLLAGCADMQHVWVPTERADARLPDSGLPAAYYQVPPAAPQGAVEVAAIGVQSADVNGQKQKILVARLIVTDNADQPWQIDLSQQRLTFATGEVVAPSGASGSVQASGGWILAVPARGKATVDLYFPVPAVKHATRTLELAWTLDAAGEHVTDRTSFRREDLEPAYQTYADYPGGYYHDYPYFYGYGSITVGPSWNYGGYGDRRFRAYGGRTIAPPPPAISHGIAPPPPVYGRRPPVFMTPRPAPAFRGGSFVAPPPARRR